MTTKQLTVAPTVLIQKIVIGGFLLASGGLYLLTRPMDAPGLPVQVVFQPADGCFYERTNEPQALKRLDRDCVSAEELAEFKAGNTSHALAAELHMYATTYAHNQRIYLTELAQHNEEKSSPFAALSRRLKPTYELFKTWCWHATRVLPG